MKRERKPLNMKTPEGVWGECPTCGPVKQEETKEQGFAFRECLKCGSTLDWFHDEFKVEKVEPTRYCENCGKERKDYTKELAGEQQGGCKVCNKCARKAQALYANPPFQISDKAFRKMIKRFNSGDTDY